MAVDRRTVDLEAWPDLVVIYLGMRVKSLKGFRRAGETNREIMASVAAKPDGLLLHESLIFSLWPIHLGMRQYWRDLASLERWTREGFHRGWWTSFLKEPSGNGFWHETYVRSGGFEAIYDDMDPPVGMARFAPSGHAKGPMFAARARLGAKGEAPASPVSESELS